MRRPILAISLLLAAAPLPAQSNDANLRDDGPSARLGMSIGIPGYGAFTHPLLTTIGVQLTAVRPRRLGPDAALAAVPVGLALGVAPLIGRAGIAYPVELTPGIMLLHSGGVTAAGLVGAEGTAAGGAGAYASLALVQIGENGGGARLGATLSGIAGQPGAVWHVELAFIPRRRR